MSNDLRQMLSAALLVLLLVFGWQWYMQKKYGSRTPPVSPPPPAAPAAAPPTDATPSAPGAGAAAALGPAAPAGAWHLAPADQPAEPLVLGGRQPAPGDYKAQITLDPRSAALDRVLLSEFKLKVDDPDTGYPLLAACRDENDRPRLPLQLGRLVIKGRPETFDLSQHCWRLLDFATDDAGRQTARFAARILETPPASDPAAADRPVLTVIKEFAYDKNAYELGLAVQLVNETRSPLEIESLEFFGPMGILREDPRSDGRRTAVAAYWNAAADRPDAKLTINRQHVTLEGKEKERRRTFEKPGDASLRWFGVVNKFFTAIVRPLAAAPNQPVDFLDPGSLAAQALLVETPPAGQLHSTPSVQVRLTPPTLLDPARPQRFSFAVYLGPIDKNVFDQPAYADFHYNKLITSGSCAFCAFDWLTALLFKMMHLTYRLVGNYGIAIIIIVFLVRLILHPVTRKSQVHMMKMNKLGPKIQELKEKYGGDPKEFQRRQVGLMKEQGMAGAALLGCLPMFLQMPIWIALYTAVDANIALRHQGLLPASWHWLNDLSAPDRLIPLAWFGLAEPVNVPLLGSIIGSIDAFNLLPVLLTVGMFLQMKFTPTQPQTAASPQAAQQQKMMQYMMPVMMLLLFYSAASGFNLYMMASTFAGLVEQHVIRKHLKEQEARAAEQTVAAPSKLADRLGPKKRKPRPPRRFFS